MIGERAEPPAQTVARVGARTGEAASERGLGDDALALPLPAVADQLPELQPLARSEEGARRQRVGPVAQRAPRADAQPDRVEDAPAQIRVGGEPFDRELAREHRAEDLQRDAAVGELLARLVLERDADRRI